VKIRDEERGSADETRRDGKKNEFQGMISNVLDCGLSSERVHTEIVVRKG
jgi:hypothetical protein